jgi:hypothetical protein
MFHESVPSPQRRRFRSPEVVGLPFVGGSIQTVMTPLRMPGLTALSADASDATATEETTTAAAISQCLRDGFAILILLGLKRYDRTSTCLGRDSPQP